MPTLEDNDSKIDNSYAEGRGGYGEHPENDGSFGGEEASRLQDMEQNFNDNASSSQENSNIANAKAKEENPDNPMNFTGGGIATADTAGSFGQKVLGFVRGKKGATTGVIGGIIGGFAGLSLIFTPGLLVFQIGEVFTNYNGASSRAAPMRAEAGMRYIVNNDKVDAACSQNASGLRCKVGTMSEKQKKQYEKAGFKFNDAKETGSKRYIIKTVEFPDGTKVTSGKAFNDYVRKNVAAASAANRGYNAAWQAMSGGIRKSAKILNFSLGDRKLDGNSEDDRKNSLNEKVGTQSETSEEQKNRLLNENKDKAGKAISKLNAANITCGAYSFSRLSVAAAKAENMRKFIPLAAFVLGVYGQAKAGDVDAGTMTTTGNILTKTASSGEKKGLAATDAQGFKIAAYGDGGSMSSLTKQYSLNGNGTLGALDEINETIKERAGGQRNVRTACKTAQGAGWLSCAAGPLGAALCAGSLAADYLGLTDEIAAKAFGLVMNIVIPLLAKSNVDINAKDFYGVDAGNVIAIGAYSILSKSNGSRGLTPGSKKEVSSFLAATEQSHSEQQDIARYDAKSTPFDTTNQYSFLGSIVRKTGVSYRQVSIASFTLMPLSLIQTGLAVSSPSASAASMQSPIKNDTLNACEDPDTTVNQDLTNIGVACDAIGNPQYVMSETELNMDISDNLDYMIGTYADESGEPIAETDYEKFVQYCTENRENEWGVSDLPITDSDEDWAVGAKCLENTDKIRNFKVFYYTKAEDEDKDYTGESSTNSDSSLTVMTYNVRRHELTNSSKRNPLVIETVKNINPDIIGFQEMDPEQYNPVSKELSGYSSTGKALGDTRRIFWKSDLFSRSDSGTWQSTKPIGSQDMPWVKLKSTSTGKEFFVFNMHTEPRDSGSNSRRADAEKLTKEVIPRVVGSSGLPVVITGDMNSSDKDTDGGDVYNILVKNGFSYTLDKALEKENEDYYTTNSIGSKPSQSKNAHHLDQIYISNSANASVSSWKNIINQTTINASDHTPVITSMIIPGLLPSSATSSTPISCSAANTPPPTDDTTRVQYQGQIFDKRTLSMIKTAEDCAKQAGIPGIKIPQGSYSTRVALSGASHSKGGAVDVSVRGLSNQQIDKLVAAFRMAGFAAWYRDGSDGAAFGGGNEHIHAAAIGTKNIGSPGQITSYCAGGDGLYGKRSDRHLSSIGRPIPAWAEAYCKRYP